MPAGVHRPLDDRALSEIRCVHQEKLTAFLMASHKRLGAKSAGRHLSSDCVRATVMCYFGLPIRYADRTDGDLLAYENFSDERSRVWLGSRAMHVRMVHIRGNTKYCIMYVRVCVRMCVHVCTCHVTCVCTCVCVCLCVCQVAGTSCG